MTPTAKKRYELTLRNKDRRSLRMAENSLTNALWALGCELHYNGTYADAVSEYGQPCADIWIVRKTIEGILNAEDTK